MRRWVGLLSVVMIAAACGGDDDGQAAPGTTAARSAQEPAEGVDHDSYETSLDEVPCDERLPDPADATVDCWELTVPMDRAEPDGATVMIPVAVLRSDAADPEPDPLIYFSGGPGGAGRGFANTALRNGLAQDRDVIVFDQRGTGASEPSLNCPEMDEAVRANLSAAEDRRTESDRAAEALLDCRDRLSAEGVDMGAYSTPITAADVEDLRRALGVETWNLFGISYGTTVAIEVARTYPDPVRSVVLDSVYSPDVEPTGPRLIDAADRAIGRLAEGCAADEACSGAHGDVGQRLDDLVEAWDEEPFEATVADPDGGTLDVVITGSDLLAGVWNAMYDDEYIPLLPSLLDVVEPRDAGTEVIVAELVSEGISLLTSPADGVRISVDCADRGRLQDAAEAEAAFDERPELASFAGLTGREGICERWGIEPVPETFNEMPSWDIPTLILVDDYDPVTPPELSRNTAESIGSSATLVETERFGHGVVTSHDCPAEIFNEFLADPDGEVDLSCVGEIGPPEFL